MAEKNKPVTETSDREIVISREFDAPRELIWEAMTDPNHVTQWWGPRGFTTTIHQMDVRPGGVWKHTMHGPDGADYPNSSIFREVVKPQRIVYAHGGRRKDGPSANFVATWTFDALDTGKTRVTIRMIFNTAAERDLVVKEFGAIEGGKQTLARLEEKLAKTPVVVERAFNAPVEMVWKAITDLSQMKQWYFASLESFKAEVGFETQFNVRNGDKDYPHIWKVIDVTPGKKIAYSWKYGGYAGESLATFELFADGEKTRIRLTHSGLETFIPESNPDLGRGNFVLGWTHFIESRLEKFMEKTALSADCDFVITRVLDAPRELVFKAWTEPKHMAQWWGPHQFTNPVCQMDVRPGGVWRIVMLSPDGVEHPAKGVYREVVKPRRIVMTIDHSELPEEWHDRVDPRRDKSKGKPKVEAVATVTFDDMQGKTKLTISVSFESATIRDAMLKLGMNEGWSQSLEKLAEELGRISTGEKP